MIYENNC